MCPLHLAEDLFATKNCRGSSMSSETYVVISVDGEGVEAGKRVLELTGPLSLAGMYALPVPSSADVSADMRQPALFHIDILFRLYPCTFQR